MNYIRDIIKQAPNTKFIIMIRSSMKIYLTDPLLIKQFNNQQNYYTKPQGIPSFKLLMHRGLLFTNQETWMRQRKLLSPSFHFLSLQNRIPVILNRCEKIINELDIKKPVELIKMSELITSGVIAESFFSQNFDESFIEG